MHWVLLFISASDYWVTHTENYAPSIKCCFLPNDNFEAYPSTVWTYANNEVCKGNEVTGNVGTYRLKVK